MHIAMFVDGWNMHGCMKLAGIRGFGWCDFRVLARQQTGHTDAIVRVKFFTSSDKPHPEKIPDKQAIWWKALKLMACEIVEGEFRPTREEVQEWTRNNGTKWREKMTDVALASHMVADCNQIEPDPVRCGEYRWRAGYDEAVLSSQDSDFVPTVKIVASKPFCRRVHVLLPPSSPSSETNAALNWRGASGPW